MDKFNFVRINSIGNENCIILSRKFHEYMFIKLNEIYFDVKHFDSVSDYDIGISSFIQSTIPQLESVKIQLFKKIKFDDITVTIKSIFSEDMILKYIAKYTLCNNKKIKIKEIHNNEYVEDIITINTKGVGKITSNNFEIITQHTNRKENIHEIKDVGGMSLELKKFVNEVSMTRGISQDILDKYSMKHIKGAILHGPPGTGKTLIARQLGELLKASSFQVISGPEIFDKWVGSSEENIRKLFDNAEKDKNPNSLHIIVFDEIDSIFKKRGSGNNIAVYDNVVNQILSKMDGVKPLNNILLIGTTNMIHLLDDALLRPGRFEVHLEISLPDLEGRKEIFDIYLSKLKDLHNEVINTDTLAKLSPGMSGAEISSIVNTIAKNSFINRKFLFSEQDLIDEINSRNKKFTFVSNYKDYLYLSNNNDIYVCYGETKVEMCSNIANTISSIENCQIKSLNCFENILSPSAILQEFQKILSLIQKKKIIVLISEFNILQGHLNSEIIKNILFKKYNDRIVFIFGIDSEFFVQ